MASAWITPRTTSKGERRYRVLYRTGGRDSTPRYAGSFATLREAKLRRDYVAGELAALRVPDVRLAGREKRSETLREAAERWKASRVDVSEATITYHRSAFNRAGTLLDRRVDEIEAADVAELVAVLTAAGKARETVRKTVTVLSMVFGI